MVYLFVAWSACQLTLPARADAPPRVQINQAIQPFALPETDSGLLVEIIRSAFKSQGIEVEFVFLPAARSLLSYDHNDVDILTNTKPNPGSRLTYTHWPVMTFRNMAVTLKKKNLSINSIADLAQLRIVTFQQASKYLGPEFADMAAHNKAYTELSTLPARMLNVDHADVVISQPDIFRYNLLNENQSAPLLDLDEYAYHDILNSPNQYWFGFRSEVLRDQFERGIAAIYKNGTIKLLFDHYSQRYATSRDMFITLDCQFLTKNKPKQCPKPG